MDYLLSRIKKSICNGLLPVPQKSTTMLVRTALICASSNFNTTNFQFKQNEIRLHFLRYVQNNQSNQRCLSHYNLHHLSHHRRDILFHPNSCIRETLPPPKLVVPDVLPFHLHREIVPASLLHLLLESTAFNLLYPLVT